MNPARVVVAVAYALATAGLLVFAFARNELVDRSALVVLAGVALLALVIILTTGKGIAWLFVSGVWIYACVMAIWRAHTSYSQEAGLGCIFAALALGALGCYIAYVREIL